MRCVGRVIALVAACLAASPFWMASGSLAQTRAGGSAMVGKARFAAPSSVTRPVLSRSQLRNVIAQRRARQAVIRADRAFSWPVQASARFDRRRGAFIRTATGGSFGAAGYGFGGGFVSNSYATDMQGPSAPVRGGPVSINDIPATTGIPAAPTPEPALYDIRRDRGGHVQLVRRQGPRVLEMSSVQGEAAQAAGDAASGPRIIRIR